VFAAVIAVAVLAAWWLQRPGERPKPVQIDKEEVLHPDEILFTEILGRPAGAPADFQCIQVYEIRPHDPRAVFHKPFTLNFFEGRGETGLEIARLVDGRWVRVETTRPRHPEVTASARVTEGGIYALGRFQAGPTD
jgi:hypothetical protein